METLGGKELMKREERGEAGMGREKKKGGCWSSKSIFPLDAYTIHFISTLS